MDELSVLDYLKLKLKPENWHRSILPEESAFEIESAAETARANWLTRLSEKIVWEASAVRNRPFSTDVPSPVITIAVLICALSAQLFIDPAVMTGSRNPLLAGIIYLIAACLLVIGWLIAMRKEAPPASLPSEEIAPQNEDLLELETSEPAFETNLNKQWALISLGCAVLAFFLFSGNRFNFLNVSFWILSIIFAIFALEGAPSAAGIRARFSRLRAKLNPVQIRLTPWTLACLAVFFISVWFRFHQLNNVPGDMFSDHAEKLADVMDIQNGTYPIFFVRNTGREAFQFYWTALMIKIFGTGISFLSLKIGTALAGLFALPFVYLLGKKLGNRWIGLTAMFLMGTAYWPNVIGRVALRFSFYPMFTAPALYFLINGLTERNRKDLILSGLFLGIGLQGYSAMRIVPLLFVLIFFIYYWTVPKADRKDAFLAFGVLIIFATLACLPLIRIATISPPLVLYRSMTRLSDIETTLQASPLIIFFENFWKALIMPFWDNGRIWVHSIPYRPALDHITASFTFIGSLLWLLRIVRLRKWQDISLLISVPVLMLPSILSIAFPDENPSLNRTGAAAIPVFILAAAGIVWLFQALIQGFKKQRITVLGILLIFVFLMGWTARNNYQLVFKDYRQNYDRNALNTRQIGQVIRSFSDLTDSAEEAYVIPYPHWVDTRLVGINAGQPGRDYALDRSLISSLADIEETLLFIFNVNDTETEALLTEIFPAGLKKLHENSNPDRQFYSYLIP